MRQKLENYLWAVALGDAVGLLIEGQSDEKRDGLIRILLDPTNLLQNELLERFKIKHLRGVENVMAGQISDDTQMTCILLKAFQESTNAKGMKQQLASRLTNAFNAGKTVGYGRTSEQAVKNFMQSCDADRSGVMGATSNGSAIRCGFLGLLTPDKEQLAELCFAQNDVSHDGDICRLSAFAQAYAVQLIDQNGQLNPDKLLQGVQDICAAHSMDPDLLTPYRCVVEDTKKQTPMLLAAQNLKALDIKKTFIKSSGISAYAPTCVAWAVYAHLQAPQDMWQTIRLALVPGGDTDSIASMAASLTSLRTVGLDNQYKDWLHDRGKPIKATIKTLVHNM